MTADPDNRGAANAQPATVQAETQGRELRLLLVEEDAADAELIVRALRRGGYLPVCERVEDAVGMRRALREGRWELVIADYGLRRFDALAAMALLRECDQDVPFVIVSGTIGEEAAVSVMKAGAHDYIMKDDLARLGPAVHRELREAEERRSRRAAEEARREEAERSAALARVSRELIGALDTPVLLERLCQVTAEVLGCDTGVTMIAEPEEDVFVAIAGYGLTREEEEIARVIKIPRQMMTVLFDRLEREEVAEVRTVPREAVGSETHLTALCTALRRGGEVVGIQTATRRLSSDGFSETQKRIATGIAQLASLALDHSRVLEELERTSRIKSEFVATVSHELRTPLNVVMGYTDLLIDGAFGELTGEQVDALRRISERARGLLELINATLDLSRLEAGRVSVDYWPVDLAEAIGAVRSDLSEWETKPKVEVIWKVPTSLPMVSTDEAKLKVVVKNLVANAMKFTDQGSITVEAARAGDGIEVSVTDTGIGVPAEQLQIIFEAFRQGDSSSTRRYGGVGLGLYIVRRLLVLLGGRIEVESEVGRGSTFRVWIPISAPSRG